MRYLSLINRRRRNKRQPLRFAARAVDFHVIQQQRRRDHSRRNSRVGRAESSQRCSRKTRLLALHEIEGRGIVSNRSDIADRTKSKPGEPRAANQ